MLWGNNSLSCCWWECNLLQPFWWEIWKLHTHLQFDTAIPLLGDVPWRLSYTNTHLWQLFCKLAPVHEDKERPRKVADHSRLVSGKFNKQGSFYIKLVLSGHEKSRSPYPPTRILKDCIEALNGFSHILVQTVSATLSSLKAVSLQQVPLWEWCAEYTFQGQGRRQLPKSSWWVNWQPRHLDTLL